MIGIISRDLLYNIFCYLHPFTLEACRLVCKQWRDFITSSQTAQHFFRYRYGSRDVSDLTITYRHQYLPLPGGECYRSLEECLVDALQKKDRSTVEYFDRQRQLFGCSSYRDDHKLLRSLFSLPSKRITHDQLTFVREHISYDLNFAYIQEYGHLVGYYGHLDFYLKELPLVPIERHDYFLRAVFIGLCLEGSPDFDAFMSRDDILDAKKEIHGSQYRLRCYYPQLKTITSTLNIHQTFNMWCQILTPQQLLAKIMKFEGDVFGYRSRAVCQAALNNENNYYPPLPELEKYLLAIYPDFCQDLNTPRGLILSSRLYNRENYHKIIYQAYRQIILRGDWEIYHDFVDSCFPGKCNPDRFTLVNKKPRQNLLYQPLYQLIETGNLGRLIDVIRHFDMLRVTTPAVVYLHCLHAAIKYGKKDLIDYFVTCLQGMNTSKKIYPLVCSSKDPDIKRYLNILNSYHRDQVNKSS